MEKQQRRLALVAQLDELRGLARALWRDRAVVADETTGAALNFQMTAHRLLIELALEFKKVRSVGEAGDDFARVVGFFRIIRDQAQQFVDGVERLLPATFGEWRQLLVPRQQADNLAYLSHAIGVVFSQVFGGAGGLCVHLGAAQLFIGGHFAGGGLEQWGTCEKQLGLAAHHHHVIRQPRLIGATRRGGAVHHGDLGQPHGRHPRLIGKAARAFDENLRRVIEVGAAAFGEGDHRQFVFHGDLLQAQGFLQAAGGDGPAPDRAVVRHHQHAHAGHVADAGDQAATGAAAVLVVVQLVAGQARQFEKRCAGVQQQVEALARQQLAAFFELRPGFGSLVQQVLFEHANLLDGAQHHRTVLGERLAVGIE
ncbi:hypothetical protein D3C76_933360 [compost metagenome]